MTSTSSIGRAGSKGSAITTRPGAVARWWRAHRGDLAKDLIIGVVTGVLLLFGAMWWDAKLVDRQNGLARSIADRQDVLAQDLAHQAEVLENIRFVRQVATSNGKAPKPFANINLEGAELGGLKLECTDAYGVGCADFLGANLQEANLTETNLAGANLMHADLRRATLDVAGFSGARLDFANLSGVVSTPDPAVGGTSFWRAEMNRATLVGARLAYANFRAAQFEESNGDEAVLSSANFPKASLGGVSFPGC